MNIFPIKHSRLIAVLCFGMLQPPLAQAGDSDGLPHAFDAGWKGEKTCAVLYETPSVRVGKCSFAPGVGHEKHYHHPHFGFVLQGSTMRVKDKDGEREVVAETGSSWSSSSLSVHEAINIGPTTASYLIIEPAVQTTPSP